MGLLSLVWELLILVKGLLRLGGGLLFRVSDVRCVGVLVGW